MVNFSSKFYPQIKITNNRPIRGIYQNDQIYVELYGINNENIREKLECHICQNIYKLTDLFIMCNKFPCQGYCCIDCITKTLNTNIVKGCIISLESMKCLFCKRNSDPKFLSHIIYDYNLLFSFYLRYRNMQKTQIGFCKCGKIQKVKINNDCNEINYDSKKDFVCDICNFNIIKNKQICQQCNNYIEKTGGCNHMTCRCGYQWCWKCRTQWGISNCTSYRCVNDYRFSIVGLLFGSSNSNIDFSQLSSITQYDKNGYDKKGFDRNGFNKDGFDKDEFDYFGFNINGQNKFGLKINDYDIDHYDKDGFDYFGYNKLGYDKNGFDYDGYNKDGYNKYGYDKNGYCRNGYNKDGYNKHGYNPRKIMVTIILSIISTSILSVGYYSFF
jgi:hypothetical protein